MNHVLMVVHPKDRANRASNFSKTITEYSTEGDVFLLTMTQKVFPARLYGNKQRKKPEQRLKYSFFRETQTQKKTQNYGDVLVRSSLVKIRVGN